VYQLQMQQLTLMSAYFESYLHGHDYLCDSVVKPVLELDYNRVLF
jgi:hypothetical protein